MNLVRALRIDTPSHVSFAGAGGKTTAMFNLARQLTPPVIVTTTTHLATWQLGLGDHHIALKIGAEGVKINNILRDGISVLTGDFVEPERVAGLDTSQLAQIHSLAEDHHIPVLIESDGSRQLPLKAPAEHEPLIPAFVDIVVVVAGLSALGKTLTPERVHRVERFERISGLSAGDEITEEAVLKVMTAPSGGLKNIPPGARRVALLNQADTEELQARAQELAEKLLPDYQSVLISSFYPSAEPAQEIGTGVFAVHESIAGILLAAGESSRLGQPKQLLVWNGKAMIYWVAEKAIAAGLSPLVVVTGAYADQIEQALAGLPVTIVYNPDWEAGQSTSVQKGLLALPDEIGGALFLLSDQPQIPATLMRTLVEAHAQTLAPIVAPMIDGQRGNPVLFDRSTFSDFFTLEGDVGGRRLFSRYQINWVEWHDRNLLLDVDTKADYQRLLELDSS